MLHLHALPHSDAFSEQKEKLGPLPWATFFMYHVIPMPVYGRYLTLSA